MVVVGVVYVTFEDSILATPGATEDASRKPSGVSRAILGVQIGLTALSILVTRTSVASLQADAGLPLGAQVVGWITLSKFRFYIVLCAVLTYAAVSSLILPFAHSLQPNRHYLHRLMVIFLAFATLCIILTIS